MGFDAYNVALEAIRRAGSTDSRRVLEALRAVTLDGVTGRIAFDNLGDAIRNTAYIKSCNTTTGNWEFVAIQRAN
jgi:branched-chain amino acid transport system substrate-binding protein